MAFTKGQSGNPGGRPRKSAEQLEIERLAREHGPNAIKRLAHWMDSDNPKASISACQVLLNRGYGAPDVSINSTVTHELGSLSDADLAAEIQREVARLASGGEVAPHSEKLH